MTIPRISLIPLLLLVVLVSGCAASTPTLEPAVETDSTLVVQEPHDETYLHNLRHFRMLSADEEFVWCGREGRYSMEEGFGNQSHPLEGADPASFTVIGESMPYESYFRDASTVYFAGVYEGTTCNALKETDTATFQQWVGPFARDTSHVYLWGAKVPVDRDSFKVLKKDILSTDSGEEFVSSLVFSDVTSVYAWSHDAPWALYLVKDAKPSDGVPSRENLFAPPSVRVVSE